MSGQDLVKFWVSILGESVFADQLETVMDIEDSEERTFKLLCKTLFLLVMGESLFSIRRLNGFACALLSRGYLELAKTLKFCRYCKACYLFFSIILQIFSRKEIKKMESKHTYL